MKKTTTIVKNSNVLGYAVCFLVLAICLFAMFGAPSMTANGPSQLGMSHPAIFVVMLIGFAIGCYGTIVGVGGGPLIVPIFVLLYGWQSEFLVATSLFVVFLNALSGSIGYARQRRIDYKGGLKFSVAALPGAILSGFVHHIFNIAMFDVIFGIFLILLAVYSLVSVNRLDRKARKLTNAQKKTYRHISFTDKFGISFKFLVHDRLGIGMNLLVGFFVGFLGIGGGVFQVPILLFLLHYPPHIATATSHYVTMLTCLFALIPHLYLGNVYFSEALWMGLGVLVGAQVGAAVAPRINSKLLIYLFVVVLGVFAIKLLV